MYTKIARGNTRGMSYQLKLNDMDCHVIYHVGFGAQVDVSSIIPGSLNPTE